TALDPATQRQISELRDRILAQKKDESEAVEARARSERIEQELAEGRRLLDDGKAAEASSRFETVLAIDPRNAAALAGSKDALERIRSSTTQQTRQQAFAD